MVATGGAGKPWTHRWRRWWHPSRPALVVFLPVAALLICEYGLYYLALARCGGWPLAAPEPYIEASVLEDASATTYSDIYLLVLADTHLLGPNGHWFDRARREWQMERAFQSALSVLGPDAAIILGDATDEGKWTTFRQWEEDVARFKRMFHHDPEKTRLEVVVGNHDIGFHAKMNSGRIRRFETDFGEANRLFFIKDQPFVMLNSMAFEDECYMCQSADGQLGRIAEQLAAVETDAKKRQPVLLLHFPLFRATQEHCTELDITYDLVNKLSEFRGDELQDGVLRYANIPNKDVMNREATGHIMATLDPAFVFSGHNHYNCLYQHSNGVKELTVSTFSWRNRADPSFVLATVHPTRRKRKRRAGRIRETEMSESVEVTPPWQLLLKSQEGEDAGSEIEREAFVGETTDHTLDMRVTRAGGDEATDEDERRQGDDGQREEVTTEREVGEGEGGADHDDSDGSEEKHEEEVMEVDVYFKRCELPSEGTIIGVYVTSAVVWLASVVSLCCGYARKVTSERSSRKMLKLV